MAHVRHGAHITRFVPRCKQIFCLLNKPGLKCMRSKYSGMVSIYAFLQWCILLGLWPLVLCDVLLVDLNVLSELHAYSLVFGPMIGIPAVFYVLENLRLSRLERRCQQPLKTADIKNRLSKTRAPVSF